VTGTDLEHRIPGLRTQLFDQLAPYVVIDQKVLAEGPLGEDHDLT
jgi:hypothetical protein